MLTGEINAGGYEISEPKITIEHWIALAIANGIAFSIGLLKKGLLACS